MNILVIDDHNILLDGLRTMLADMDNISTVTVCDNAEAALQFAIDNPNTDLVLIDLNMPGMNGLSFIHALNARKLLMPTVVLSATKNINDVGQALNAGAVGYIPKDYNLQQMKQAIHEVVNYGHYVPEDIREHLLQIDQHRKSDTKANYGLSERQIRVLEMLAQGHSNKAIADILNISENTVKSHLQVIFDALSVTNRTECVVKAKELELIVA